MPKTEGDEVEYLYRPYLELGDALVAKTTKSEYVVAVALPRDELRATPIKDQAAELAKEMDYHMNLPSRILDPSDPVPPELGVEIDPEKIRAALEAGLPARSDDAEV